MTYTSLDSIVRKFLIDNGYPIHWYMQTLSNAVEVLRELHFDVLKSVNTTLITINDYHAADLPDDYVDFTKVGVKTGQFVRPLVQRESINRLTNIVNNEKADYPGGEGANGVYYAGGAPGFGFYWGTNVWNQYGENTGREYGLGAGEQTDTYKVIPERNQIQFHQSFRVGQQIVLEYITDGTSCNTATMVDPYAQACIKAFCLWKMAEQNRSKTLGERQLLKQEYDLQYRRLRSRKNGLTVNDIKRIFEKSYTSSPK